VKAHRGTGWTLIEGDCLEAMKRLRENSLDAVVTDPPYGLGEVPDMAAVLRAWLAGEVYVPSGRGFMGKAWDAFIPGPEIWREALRILKPGGHLLTFGGSRTFDLVGLAVRLAGFEIRDTLSWMYGTGFPKSLDVSKAMDLRTDEEIAAGVPMPDAAREWEGWGTALKPAWEPVIMARKPLSGTVAANVQQWGTGALNIDGCRIAGEKRSPGFVESLGDSERRPRTMEGGAMARNNGDGLGRWPANVILDEHVAELLDAQTGTLKSGARKGSNGDGVSMFGLHGGPCAASEGGASRFFYVAKASRSERDTGCEALPARSAGEATDRSDDTAGLSSPRAGAGRTGGARNIHPTVKPVELMRWLCRLVTPPGGYVFDPFTGSGSTGVAALQEGFTFGGCEREPEYTQIAVHRLTHASRKP
jgi:DNA modification methylase